MNQDAKLGEIVSRLQDAGVSALVMGGHAVRYYGYHRATNDYDLCVSADAWDLLADAVASLSAFSGTNPVEGPSWRINAFRRWSLGKLPDGKDEWLEFWLTNHLLAPTDELFTRAEVGQYAGHEIRFLSLRDLIRSKETERESDWRDVERLEDLADARGLARTNAGAESLEIALASLRSRAGYGEHVLAKSFANQTAVDFATATTNNPITRAFLLPHATPTSLSQKCAELDPVVERNLRKCQSSSPLHLSLVEVVRRQYIRDRMSADHADKERVRRELES